MLKRLIPILIFVLFISACSGGANLKIAKKSFTPAEKILVTYKAPADLPSNAWIGIIPSSVAHGDEVLNDKHDLSYRYLSKSTAGEMTLYAPREPGSYDLRMNNRDDNGKEIASVTFEVVSE